MTYRATFETASGEYQSFVDAPRVEKARKFFEGWQERLEGDGLPFRLLKVELWEKAWPGGVFKTE